MGWPNAVPLLAVGQRVGEGLLRDGQRGDADRDALPRQVLHQGDEPAALVAEQVRGRHPDVGEEQLRGVLRVHAELVEVAAAGEAGHAALDHQQADPPVPGRRVGARDHDHEVAELAVGDERLLPVQHVMVARTDRGAAYPLQVAARPGLGHRDRRDELPRAVAGEPALPLLRRAEPVQVRPDHVVVQLEHRAAGARPGQLLVQHDVVPVVGLAAAAVLLVDVDAEQPGPARGQPHVAGHDPVPLPLLVVGRDLLRDEGPHHVTERVVLLVKISLFIAQASTGIVTRTRAYCETLTSKVVFHICPSEPGMPGNPVELTDPRMMRALAHPARIAIWMHLGLHGPATATECAEIAGLSPSACSYHLRTLARYGFVEEDPDSAADGRERPWRARMLAFSIDDVPGAPAATQVASRCWWRTCGRRRRKTGPGT